MPDAVNIQRLRKLKNMSSHRKLSYSLAINEALHQAMAVDKRVMLIGQGVKSPWYVGNTAQGLLDRFGSMRVIDTPVSENGITGVAAGAALGGMKPVVVHPRVDFMMYAFDPIMNQAANWFYMNGGQLSVPVVFWGIINRGGEQAAQHSQALHAMFAHMPGLKVVMPANPYDAKGLMVAAIRDRNPVVFMDDRWLYGTVAEVPSQIYSVPIGKANILTCGKDVTIAACSYLVPEAVKAAETLKEKRISAEIIDLRTIKPLDIATVVRSVSKTRRLLVADVGWLTGGVSAELAASVGSKVFRRLKAPIARLSLPDCPAPASRFMEASYYPRAKDIEALAKKLVARRG